MKANRKKVQLILKDEDECVWNTAVNLFYGQGLFYWWGHFTVDCPLQAVYRRLMRSVLSCYLCAVRYLFKHACDVNVTHSNLSYTTRTMVTNVSAEQMCGDRNCSKTLTRELWWLKVGFFCWIQFRLRTLLIVLNNMNQSVLWLIEHPVRRGTLARQPNKASGGWSHLPPKDSFTPSYQFLCSGTKWKSLGVISFKKRLSVSVLCRRQQEFQTRSVSLVERYMGFKCFSFDSQLKKLLWSSVEVRGGGRVEVEVRLLRGGMFN